jgi:hypothetical protein
MRDYKIDAFNSALPQSRTSNKNLDQSLDQLSWLMDGMFRIPFVGWRFGLDALIGLVPWVGDSISSLANFYVLIAAVRYRVPKVTILRMGINVGIDYLIGLIPFVGDVTDAWWKSTQKNVNLLKKHASVDNDTKDGRLSDWLFVGVIILVLIGMLVGSIAISLWLLSFVFQNIHLPFIGM